jgi:hypothetical protein
MGIYKEIDIQVTPSGDMQLAANGDFLIANGSIVLKQDIAFRMRTDQGDFIPHPDIGAGLTELIGEPNTRETTKNGESMITHSLVYDGMVSSVDLSVRGVPISLDSVVYYVFVNTSAGQLNVTPEVVFNMMSGLTNLPGV